MRLNYIPKKDRKAPNETRRSQKMWEKWNKIIIKNKIKIIIKNKNKGEISPRRKGEENVVLGEKNNKKITQEKIQQKTKWRNEILIIFL